MEWISLEKTIYKIAAPLTSLFIKLYYKVRKNSLKWHKEDLNIKF